MGGRGERGREKGREDALERRGFTQRPLHPFEGIRGILSVSSSAFGLANGVCSVCVCVCVRACVRMVSPASSSGVSSASSLRFTSCITDDNGTSLGRGLLSGALGTIVVIFCWAASSAADFLGMEERKRIHNINKKGTQQYAQ